MIDIDSLSESDIQIALGRMTLDDRIDFLQLLEARERRIAQSQLFRMFPDETTLHPDGKLYYARRLYQKHLEFFRSGMTHRERCAMCANRVGKTFGMGGYEIALHLTGLYPDWWEGRRFELPIRAWACGKTNESTRDIVQLTLLGEVKDDGNRKTVTGDGMIPGWLLGYPTWKSGVPNMVDTIKVQHTSGGWSILGFKSYQQGRGAFEGTAQHVIWPDEEPPVDVYGEMIVRTATTNGIIMLTFTPLEGMSDTVMQFLPKTEGII
jgi:phage terminase large subunit-like protein